MPVTVTEVRNTVTIDGDNISVVSVGTQGPAGAGGSFTEFRYAGGSGATVFSGLDADGNTLAYTAGAILVFIDGSMQRAAAFTATNGTSITFVVAPLTGAEIIISAM